MTLRDEVLAVVVSYNGHDRIRETVQALQPQVARVHIVDNGSDGETLAVLTALEAAPGVTVERLGANRGISVALNRGVAAAAEGALPWVLTMDQDSLVDAGFVEAYGRALAEHPDRACLSPTITTGARAMGTLWFIP